MKKLIIPLLSLLFIAGCSKDENNPSTTTTDPIETFFSLDLDTKDLEILEDGYILLNDAEGNVLGHEKITEAKKYEFKSKKSKLKGNILLSLLFLKKDETKKVFRHRAVSIQNVPLNSSWSMNLRKSDENNPKIKFTLKVEGNNWVNIGVNPYLKEGSGYNVRTSGSSDANSFVLDVTITKADKYLVTAEENKAFKYYWLENVKDNETRNLSFKNDFKDYASSLGIEDKEGYEYINYSASILENLHKATVFSGSFSKKYDTHTPKLYFITEEGKYKTTISASNYSNGNEKNSYRYEKVGAKPTTPIIIPKTNFSATQKVFFDTKFTTDITDYTFTETEWYWTDKPLNNYESDKFSSIRWNILTDGKSTFKAPNLPEDIKTEYPNFNATKLKYDGTTIKKGLTYQEFLNEQFGFNPFNKEEYTKEEFGF